jgi:uncharacterized repeat protein (TIGR02543 family)
MNTRLIRRVAAVLAASSFVLMAGFAQTQAAQASANDITLYLSPPLVQGSNVSGAGTLLESFNTASLGPCPTTVATGTLAINIPSACSILSTSDVSGASTTTADPTFGGSGSNSPGTGWYNPGQPIRTVTFGFTSPVKYVGFWWSGGSPGNVVEFLKSGTVVATYDSGQIESILGADAPTSWPAGNGYVTSVGSTQYAKGLYFGNPRGFTSNPPEVPSSIGGGSLDAQYVYFNLYMPTGKTVDAVRFSGPGFEWDNVVTSTEAQTPPDSFVFASNIAMSNSVTFLANAQDATGTMNAQAATTTTNLSANAFSRTGYTFSGWNTDQGGTGTPYTNEQSYDFSADLTLYAQWTPDAPTTHTVTFEPNGGSGSATTQVTTGSVALDTNTFTREGYVFAGWNTQQDGQGTPYADGATFDFSADQTLWAQWDVDPNPPAPTPDAPSIDKLLNTGLSILGPAGTTGLLVAIGAPFFLLSDRFRRIRSHGALVVHKSAHVTITTPAKFFDRLRKKNK